MFRPLLPRQLLSQKKERPSEMCATSRKAPLMIASLLVLSLVHMLAEINFDANLFNRFQLRFNPIDMFFLTGKNSL